MGHPHLAGSPIRATPVVADLVYAVGMHRGDDTAYYLRSTGACPPERCHCPRGWGHPVLRLRGPQHLEGRAGRDPAAPAPGAGAAPYYLKVDIEGPTTFASGISTPGTRPSTCRSRPRGAGSRPCTGSRTPVTRASKLIDQLHGFVQMTPPLLHSWTLAGRLGAELARRTLRRIPGLAATVRGLRALRPPTLQAPPAFRVSSSGPRPDESDGPWRTLEEVTYAWLYYVRPTSAGPWYDVHATR